jgi:predicted DNA-binding transcriptional regulator AlpA
MNLPEMQQTDSRQNARLIKPTTIEPMLVPAKLAAPMCGRSVASWWRDHAARRVPAPVKLGGRTLWRVEELRQWISAGCPDRQAWDATQVHTQKLNRLGS